MKRVVLPSFPREARKDYEKVEKDFKHGSLKSICLLLNEHIVFAAAIPFNEERDLTINCDPIC